MAAGLFYYTPYPIFFQCFKAHSKLQSNCLAMKSHLLAVCCLFLFAFQPADLPKWKYARQGHVKVKGGKVWYGVMGKGDQTPVMCLHGGPGGTGYGFLYLYEIAKDRPVIMFDQLGGGRSTIHEDTSLLKVDNFVEQVEAVRKELKLDELYVLGHSWGTALALEYYDKYPDAVKALVFNSPYFSTPIWTADADTLIAGLPKDIQTDIRQAEADSLFTTPEYEAANTYFLSQHGRRNERQALPFEVERPQGSSFIYNFMWGPSEFTATGTLRDYDNHQSLKNIKVPALFTTGEFDEARPSTIERLSQLTPDSRFVMIPGAGHSTMNDNLPALVEAVDTFLEEQDTK